jgi:hypothetical protein
MTPFKEFYKDQYEYPGSYKLLCHSKSTFRDPEGKPHIVEYMHTCNPNNITDVSAITIKYIRKWYFIPSKTGIDPYGVVKHAVETGIIRDHKLPRYY